MAPKLSIHLGGSTRATSGLTPGNLQFAAQLGVTHIVTSDEAGEMIPKHNGFWAVEDLVAVRERVEAGGLTLAAIENFPADHWDRILLGADGREEQLENLGRTITNMGKAGIPCMGYCFSLTGAFGRAETVARGSAPSEGFAESEGTHLLPLPVGYVWNRWVEDPGRATLPTFRTGPDGVKEHREAVDRHKAAGGEFLAPVSVEEMWERFEWFLTRLLPFAEAAGVRLAAHPNDPPLPVHRGMGCPLNTPQAYQRLLGISDSYFNACEFCQGTVAQMEQGGEFVQGAIREYGKRIAYVHFRNVIGKAPDYNEVFLDEGDVDMVAAMRSYKEAGFDGVFQPDHTPIVTLPPGLEGAAWHTGMAFAVGYMKAAAKAADYEFELPKSPSASL